MSTFGDISGRIVKIDFVPQPLREDEICIVDQYMAQDFCIGDNGFIQNDLVSLMKSQSLQEQQQILNRLVQLQTDDMPQDLTDEEKFALLRGRMTQTFAELDHFGNVVLTTSLNKVKEQLKDVPSVENDSSVQKTEDSVSDSK